MDILDILLDILLKPPQPFIGLFFPTKDSVINYNNTILEQSPGKSITITTIDSPPIDITHSMQEQVLIAAHKKDINSTGNLPYQLTIKIGQLYELTANIAVDDGMVNGTECYVRGIEDNPSNVFGLNSQI